MSTSSALKQCKINIFAALSAELTPPAVLPKMLVISVNSLNHDSAIAFLSAGEFNPGIAEDYLSAREGELELENAINAIPLWMKSPFDRRDLRFSTSFRYPTSGLYAVSASIREKNLIKESSATSAGMAQAPENTMKALSTFTKAAVLPWLTKERVYRAAGGSRAIINLLTPECKDEISTAIISTADPVVREVDTMDEREVVHIVTTFFRAAKASDMTALESAFEGIAMKASAEFTPGPLAAYLGRCARVLNDNKDSIPGYAVKTIVALMLKHLSPKEFAAAVSTKKDSFLSTASCIAGIRDTGLLFEDHSNVQKFYTSPSKVPPVEKLPPPPPAGKFEKQHQPEITRLKQQVVALKKAAAAAAIAPGVDNQKSSTKPAPGPAKATSDCPNCKKDFHFASTCTEFCHHSKCSGMLKHIAKECPNWRGAKGKAMLAAKAERHAASASVITSSANYGDSEVRLPKLSMKLSHSISTSTSVAGGGYLNRIQVDTGSNILCGPAPLSGCAIVPITDSVSIADDSSVAITGRGIVRGEEFFLAPTFSNALMPQSFISRQNCSTVLVGNKLIILNTIGTISLQQFLAANASLVACSTIAQNGLYFLSQSEFDCIRDDSDTQVPSDYLYHSMVDSHYVSAVNTYHTVKFATLKDLVYYWHRIFRHCNKEKFLAIVEHKIFKNLPKQLTVEAINKNFPSDCVECAVGSIQLITSPPSKVPLVVPKGAHWQADYKKFLGADSHPIASVGGYSHTFSAKDECTDFVHGSPVKGTSRCHDHFTKTWKANKQAGYTMLSWTVDKEFFTKEMKKACADCVPPVTLRVAPPDEHFGIGGIERWHRNIHESIAKMSVVNPNVTPEMWNLGYQHDVYMYNSLPTAKNPASSPNFLYLGKTHNAASSPILPYGSVVVAQIPLARQTTHSGRGLELVFVGCSPHNFGDVQLYNPKTKRVVTRRSIRYMGNHPLRGFVFENPVEIEGALSEEDYDVVTTPVPSPSDTAPVVAPAAEPIAAPLVEPGSTPAVDSPIFPDIGPANHYQQIMMPQVTSNQRKFFARIGTTFSENLAEGIDCVWRIRDIVRANGSKDLYFRYYDLTRFPTEAPLLEDEFEYTLCRVLNTARWADFAEGKKIAHMISKAIKDKIPTSYAAMLIHPERAGFEASLKDECQSYWDNLAVIEEPDDFDWSAIDKNQMGDLMIIFSKKYFADGTFDKYKCRIVFRGDRWQNTDRLSTYSSSMEEDAFKLMVGVAATEDLDLFALDVKTAFLHGIFPNGIEQWVRSPYGVPANLLPRKFRLGKCTYGHPLASQRWDEHSDATLRRIGFTPIISSPAVLVLEKDGERLVIGKCTDDFLCMCKFDSPLKKFFIASLIREGPYTLTVKDPVTSFTGLTISRNRSLRNATLTQQGHIDGMAKKYPLAPGESYPTTPMQPLSPTLSAADAVLNLQFLSDERITELQSMIGDSSWVAHKTRPDALFGINMCARHGLTPTELDFKKARHLALYIIDTRHLGLVIGGRLGMHLTATVDSSFGTHRADGKSHSSWTTHLGGGGSFLTRSKKQSVATDNTAIAELVGAHMGHRDILWSQNFCREIGFPIISVTTLFIDNASTLKIIAKKTHAGMTRHIDLRYHVIREAVQSGRIRCKHLTTANMIADIGTKALAYGPFTKLRSYILGHDTLQEFFDDYDNIDTA